MCISQATSVPVGVGAALHVDDARRAEVGPGELLLARPHELHRPARGLGQPRRLHRALAGVLAAVARAGVGDDHPDLVFRHAEGLGQLAPHAERPLGARPDGEPAVASTPPRPRAARGGRGRCRRRCSRLESGAPRRQPSADRADDVRRAARRSRRAVRRACAGARRALARGLRRPFHSAARRLERPRRRRSALGARRRRSRRRGRPRRRGIASRRRRRADASIAPRAGGRRTLP